MRSKNDCTPVLPLNFHETPSDVLFHANLVRRALLLVGLMLATSSNLRLRTVSGKFVVTQLPGFDGPLPFELETGYVAVDELEDVNLFYYFVKSERKPAEDPLLLWLTGGPGCSAFSGLAFEIGPIALDFETYSPGSMPSLFYREESWSGISNIIFLDTPAGTGFSYSKAAEEEEWSDTKEVMRLLAFIRKWLLDHPEFISNPFYIAGDSHGSKTGPSFALEVIISNEAGTQPFINLKGYLAGNPVTMDNFYDEMSKIPFAHGMGLISEEMHKALEDSCGRDYVMTLSVECAKNIDALYEILKDLRTVHILEPNCQLEPLNATQTAQEAKNVHELEEPSPYSLRSSTMKCHDYGYLAVIFWANNDTVREALGIRKEYAGDWKRCRRAIANQYTRYIPSSVPYFFNLSSRGFRGLVYSGDHDLMVNHMGTQAWIRGLGWPLADDWRPWWVEGQVAGYTKSYTNNLTYATVKGAGHTAPEYKPKECWSMFERWISGGVL